MKKIIYAIAILAAATLAFSCGKDKPEDKKVQKRLAMCGDDWDKYYFTYNEDGSLASALRNPAEDGTYERTWTFTWAGKVGTAAYVKEGEAKGNWVFTFGDNGYLSTLANEWGDTWAFTYDNAGYLTKIVRSDKDPVQVKSNCVWENGDLKKWSRFSDGVEQFKMQTFLDDENVAGIFPDACDKADVARWIFELGYCGKPSKHLLDQAAWDGTNQVAVQEYTKDDDGFVTKVSKVFDGGDPEFYYYTWEVLK